MIKKMILYLEDNEMNRFIVEEMASVKYEVDAVETAKECFEAAKANNYDFLLIDLNLNDPNIDGFDVLRELKSYENLKHTVFVAHTNYYGGNWEEKCLEAGFDYYYPKPFNLDTFSKMVAA